MIAEGAVEPHAVVKDFNPFKNGGAGFAARGEAPLVNQFAFQRAPEAFHRRIVIAVAPAAQAANHASGVEVLPVKLAGVLDAPVGVMPQPGVAPATRAHADDRSCPGLRRGLW